MSFLSLNRSLVGPIAIALLCTAGAGSDAWAGDWQSDFESAQAESRRTGKPLLLHFHAEWCGPCRQMEQMTLHRPEISQMLGSTVVGVKINADHRPDLVRQFGVSSLPSDVLIDAGGKTVARNSGFQSAGQYVAALTPAATRAAAAYKPRETKPLVAKNEEKESRDDLSTSAPVMVVSSRPPMLRGYSPVALHESREWIKGAAEFTSEYRGQIYRMASSEEKTKFDANPRRYTPRLLGCDAIVFNKEDRAVLGKLDYAAFYGDELYLFKSDANRRDFKSSPDRYITTRIVQINDIESVVR